MGRPNLKRRRLMLAEQQGWRCWWCGGMMSKFGGWGGASIEHLVPLSRGGARDNLRNLVAAHVRCNNNRQDKEHWVAHPMMRATARWAGVYGEEAAQVVGYASGLMRGHHDDGGDGIR